MKLTVDREALLFAARAVAPATLQKSSTPMKALQWCRCSVVDDALTLTATDTEVWMSAAVPATAARAGVAVVSPHTVAKILGEHREKEVRLVGGDRERGVTLLVGGATYNLDAEDPAAFPHAPDAPAGEPASAASAALAAAIRSAVGAAGEDTTEGGGKFTTEAVQLALGPIALAVVGTDGMRQHQHVLGGAARPEAAALLPVKAARMIAAALARLDPETPAALSFDKHAVRVAAGPITVSCGLTCGKPVPWQPVGEWDCPVRCDRAALTAAVRGGLIAEPAQKALDLAFAPADSGDGGKLTVRSQGKGGSAETGATLAGVVPLLVFRMNGSHLSGFLANSAAQDAELGFTKNVLLVRAGDGAGGVFRELARPVKAVGDPDAGMVICANCGQARRRDVPACGLCKQTEVAA